MTTSLTGMKTAMSFRISLVAMKMPLRAYSLPPQLAMHPKQVDITTSRLRTHCDHHRQNCHRRRHPVHALYCGQNGLGLRYHSLLGCRCSDSVRVDSAAEGQEPVASQQLQHYFLLDLEEQNSKGDRLDHNFPEQHRDM